MTDLAVARLWFRSNSFNPRRTGLDDVRRAEWIVGAAAETHPWAPASEIAGVRRFVAARPDWRATMLRCASAPAGGPLMAGVFSAWLAEIISAVQLGQFDALFLSLSGACQVEGDPSTDLSVLRHLRAVAPRLPIVATFDARANLSEEVPLLLDGASVACGPGDGAAAAGRALGLLEGMLQGRWRPVGMLARLPVCLVPAQLERAATAAGAFPSLQAPSLLECGACCGFPWADAPSRGAAALAWADHDAHAAREAAAALALALGRVAADALPAPSIPEAMTRAISLGRGLLLDLADDPELGGSADTVTLLQALLEADLPSACGVLAAPAALAAAIAAGEGGDVALDLGSSIPMFGPALHLRGRVQRLGEGLAVIRSGPVSLLVAERPAVADPALLARAGIDPLGLRLLVIKGGEAAGAAFATMFPRAIGALCPGPTSPVLADLPFAHPPGRGRAQKQGPSFS